MLSRLAMILLAGWLGIAPLQTWAITEETIFGAELPAQSGDVRFIGEASPNATVTFLRNGVVIGTDVAAANSAFDKTITSQELTTATYGIYATDGANRQTRTIDFSVTILPAQTVNVTDILLPPTFAVAISPIKRPQTQSTLGSGRQDSTVTSFYFGAKYGDSFTRSVGSDASGNWGISAGRTLHLGTYTTNAVLQAPGGALSPVTQDINFQVLLSADLNVDNRVNLTDFSILMFFYNGNTDKPADINDDGRANLTDLSIMLFYWTG